MSPLVEFPRLPSARNGAGGKLRGRHVSVFEVQSVLPGFHWLPGVMPENVVRWPDIAHAFVLERDGATSGPLRPSAATVVVPGGAVPPPPAGFLPVPQPASVNVPTDPRPRAVPSRMSRLLEMRFPSIEFLRTVLIGVRTDIRKRFRCGSWPVAAPRGC